MEPTIRDDALAVHLVTSYNSPEFTHLNYALTHSSVIGLDAEWKPNRHASTFPTVSLLQIACRLVNSDESPVFLLDLQAIPLPSVYELLRQVFVSPDVVKLGFRFKQDLVYLSSTFCEQGCNPGFDRVEPFMDITAVYHYLQPKQPGRRITKQNKSLATICNEVLGISLSKKSRRYAAEDAHCLIEIFNVFHAKVVREGNSSRNQSKHLPFDFDPGLKQIAEISNGCNMVTRTKFCEASNMIRLTTPELHSSIEIIEEVEGLAKHLRCVGIDAAIPYSKKPEARIKSLLKNDQLLEVIETFQLKISENQLMSRCTKCNGRFIQKPLTTEEAVEAAKGFQVIPSCLFNKNLEFWQCMDCNQLYWEGTQYHNAVQKFIDVCKLNEQP
ncbi:UNVERIFIED_CONTAM: hypothetical protein Scaly_2453800 [Sesamum calycinum]|uniref:3'-5' exonuclease domain-containing protein n=1 Tax=Sesamum calycinum TaxID=2727403 RepID=A0AAW2LQX2_9LAMI